ncbi:hypothetical protein [Veillonella intestinalis]|uniref:hypothetical protein n=1 Tax=Veillonella intestinalis TaxID=2941341 RepID=UPI00203FC505|nr:hypothetical protein [Veillonella intestinalis]
MDRQEVLEMLKSKAHKCKRYPYPLDFHMFIGITGVKPVCFERVTVGYPDSNNPVHLEYIEKNGADVLCAMMSHKVMYGGNFDPKYMASRLLAGLLIQFTYNMLDWVHWQRTNDETITNQYCKKLLEDIGITPTLSAVAEDLQYDDNEIFYMDLIATERCTIDPQYTGRIGASIPLRPTRESKLCEALYADIESVIEFMDNNVKLLDVDMEEVEGKACYPLSIYKDNTICFKMSPYDWAEMPLDVYTKSNYDLVVDDNRLSVTGLTQTKLHQFKYLTVHNFQQFQYDYENE